MTNQTRQAQSMRRLRSVRRQMGLKEIIVWVPAAEAEAFRGMANTAALRHMGKDPAKARAVFKKAGLINPLED